MLADAPGRPRAIASEFLNTAPQRQTKMDQDAVTRRLDAAESRIFALTTCLATVLKHSPQAASELHRLADHLDDAPPVAVSDARLSAVASHIRVALGGEWDGSAEEARE
jgi:hypothetical protein